MVVDPRLAVPALAGTIPGSFTFSDTPLLRPEGESEPAIANAADGTMAIAGLQWLFNPSFFGISHHAAAEESVIGRSGVSVETERLSLRPYGSRKRSEANGTRSGQCRTPERAGRFRSSKSPRDRSSCGRACGNSIAKRACRQPAFEDGRLLRLEPRWRRCARRVPGNSTQETRWRHPETGQ